MWPWATGQTVSITPPTSVPRTRVFPGGGSTTATRDDQDVSRFNNGGTTTAGKWRIASARQFGPTAATDADVENHSAGNSDCGFH